MVGTEQTDEWATLSLCEWWLGSSVAHLLINVVSGIERFLLILQK